jgi:hypothetical protein
MSDANRPRKLLEEPWSYTLWEEPSGALLLSVTCGTSAVFEVTFRLTDEERAGYVRSGEDFVRLLAGRVTGNPDAYASRDQGR